MVKDPVSMHLSELIGHNTVPSTEKVSYACSAVAVIVTRAGVYTSLRTMNSN
jgi:hypothetical protein